MPKQRLITHEGQSLSVSEWSKRTGIPYATLLNRLNTGWPTDEALTEPVGKPPSPLKHPKMSRRCIAPDRDKWGPIHPSPVSVKLPVTLWDFVKSLGPDERQPWLRQAIFEAWKRQQEQD